jgi:hypothetical protein
MRIYKNLTRYNTEDLQVLLDAASQSNIAIIVRYGEPLKSRRRRSRREVECDHARFDGHTLRISGLKRIEDHLSPAEALAFKGCRNLPSKVVDDIAYAVSHHFRGKEPQRNFIVRVERRVQTPQARRVRSAEERHEALRERHGFNFVLEGSSRTSEWYWKSKLDSARSYYEREWDRRDAWRQKLLKEGVEVRAHETWGEFLRRKAEEWDIEQKRRAEWAARRFG